MFNPNQNWRVPLFLRATVIRFLIKKIFQIHFLFPERGRQKVPIFLLSFKQKLCTTFP